MPYKRLIIAQPRLSDAATISCSSEQGSMPASNLIRSPYPSDAYRSLGGGGDILFTFHLPEEDGLRWDLVAPLYTNSSGDGTWQIIAAMTEAGLDDPTFEDAVRPLWPVPNMMRPGSPEWRHALRWLKGNVRTEPWVRVIWSDPNPVVPVDVVDPFVQMSQMPIALAWQPSYHHDRGSQLQPANEAARRIRTQGGGTRLGAGARPRRFAFNVGFLSRDEMLTRGYELDRLVGTSGPVLVIDDPEDPVHMDKAMIYGTLPEAGAEKHEDTDTYSKPYTIEELL